MDIEVIRQAAMEKWLEITTKTQILVDFGERPCYSVLGVGGLDYVDMLPVEEQDFKMWGYGPLTDYPVILFPHIPLEHIAAWRGNAFCCGKQRG